MKIVAPAGNIERFYSAIKATADEVYLGLKGFGARRKAENFSLEEIKEAIDYSHTRGGRVFLTLNTIMTNLEIEVLYPKIKELYNYGLDAIIVQDIGYAKYLHENFPNIEIHGSTQMTVGNYHEINFLKTLGFKRIVLPRELSFEEIKTIRENTDMELEVFVSGALCISFSGNCYMSSFVGGRSGNRGMCAQPCRKEYRTSCGEKSYFLSPKDQLYGFEEIKKLKEIDVDSIKIEGRMKDATYVYETVSYFRKLLEKIDENNNKNNNKNEITEEKISKIFNRGYSKGYFYGTDKSIINSEYSYNIGEKIGEIKKGELKLEVPLIYGDGLSFLSKDYKILGGTNFSHINIKGEDKKNKDRKIVNIGEKIILDCPMGTRYVYKNFNKAINDEVAKDLKLNDKKLEIYGEFYAKLGEKIKFILKTSETTHNNLLQKDREWATALHCRPSLRGLELSPQTPKKSTKNFLIDKIGGIGGVAPKTDCLIESEANAVKPKEINLAVVVEGKSIIETAKNKSLPKEEIIEKLSAVGDSEFIIKNIEVLKNENIFIPLSELKNIKREAIEKFREKVLNYYRRDLDEELKKLNKKYFKLNIEKDKTKNLEIVVLLTNEEQKKFIESQKEKYKIAEIYYRTYDIAKQGNLKKHNLKNPLASNFYELLKNENQKVMLNWNMNIVNSYSIKVLEEIEKIDSFIISPEVNFSKINNLGKTNIKKGLLIYSKLKGMTIDVDLASEKSIRNEQGDIFIINKNNYGTEIFLDKPLNIINIMDDIEKLNVDKVVLEFTTETVEEIEKILLQLESKKGEYREYNYKRGVY